MVTKADLAEWLQISHACTGSPSSALPLTVQLTLTSATPPFPPSQGHTAANIIDIAEGSLLKADETWEQRTADFKSEGPCELRAFCQKAIAESLNVWSLQAAKTINPSGPVRMTDSPSVSIS